MSFESTYIKKDIQNFLLVVVVILALLTTIAIYDVNTGEIDNIAKKLYNIIVR